VDQMSVLMILSMMCYYYADLIREARGGVRHGVGKKTLIFFA
jgi:hypothetical protein